MDIGSAHIGWVDVAWLLVLAVSVLVGVLKGLVSQVLSLLGWGVAYFGSQWWGADLAAFLPVGQPGTALNVAAGIVVAFVALLLAWSGTSWLVQQLVRASPLSAADRLLGGLFGVARAVIIGLVVSTLVGLTSFARSDAWLASQGAQWLQVMVSGVQPLLPPGVSRYLPGNPLHGFRSER